MSSTGGQPPTPGERSGWPIWRSFLLGSALVVALTATAVATAGFMEVRSITDALRGGRHLNLGTAITPAQAGDPQTLLLIGSDKRAKATAVQDRTSPPHSDTMLLVRLDPDRPVTSMLSIPRDLKVTIHPDRGPPSTQKINAAYSIGGDKLAVRTVERVLHIHVNHVIDVGFAGFRAAVDRIGCVYVDVDRRYFNDNAGAAPGQGYATINIQPGYQKLCGQDALDYVRYRHTDTDLVRNARQQDFLRQAKQQVGISGLLADRGELERIFGRYTQTDIRSGSAVLQLLELGIFSAGHPVRQVHFRATIGPSFVYADQAQIQASVHDFLDGPAGPASGSGATSGHGPHGGRRTGPPPPVTLTPAADSDRMAAHAAARRLPFALQYPLAHIPGSIEPDTLRVYALPDERGHRHHAYRAVVDQGLLGDYYGVEGTDWMDPPILRQSHDTQTIGRRTYRLYYDGQHLRLIAWSGPHAVYWLSNTLELSLSNAQMIALAQHTRAVR